MAKNFKFTKKQIIKQQYMHDGSTALIVKNGWERIATLTVCVADSAIEKDEVVIKDWAENEGVLQDLIEMGVVSEPIRTLQSGFVVCHICKLLI